MRPLPPELVWHLKGMGLDALDLFPEALGQPSAAGICEPAQLRRGSLPWRCGHLELCLPACVFFRLQPLLWHLR